MTTKPKTKKEARKTNKQKRENLIQRDFAMRDLLEERDELLKDLERYPIG